jgi:NADPH:quinone reductase-like Zn-dependent oxidoreductase
VVITLRAAALNHRDLWIKLGQYAGLKYPIVPGSDGAGVIASRGEGVHDWADGDEVVINPSFGWGVALRHQGPDFCSLGLPRDGTLAEQIVVPASQLSAKPEHLDWPQAAALPLAGLTAYRAMVSRAQVMAGDRVLISGVGGGVALMALQFSVALGAEVWVTSSSQEKLARAETLGAQGGFDYTAEGWAEVAAAKGGFSLILDSAGGPGFGDLIDLAAPGGRIVFCGATRGNPDELPMRKVFWKQLSLLGTTMGSPGDWADMLDCVAAHRIVPEIAATYPLAEAEAAFALMAAGGQCGKIVLTS